MKKMKNWDWKDFVMFTALFIGIIVELALAISAILFVCYEIWHFIGSIFAWVCDNIPADALPFLMFLIAAIGFGVIYYDHVHSIEAEEVKR